MRVDMVMPQMGESIAEATILQWKKKAGEAVEKDEIILEISTDKVDSEIPAPASGTLVELLFDEGSVVPVKEKIATIDTSGDAQAASTESSSSATTATEAPTQTIEVEAPATSAPLNSNGNGAPAAQPVIATHEPQFEAVPSRANRDSDRFYSPLVRSLAAKHGISQDQLDSIQGSGHSNRVTKEDLLAYIDGASGPSATTSAVPSTTQGSTATTPPPPATAAQRVQIDAKAATESSYGDDVEIVPMNNMRQAIAEHMVRSKATSPHVYSVQEIDVTSLSKWRKEQKGEFKKREGFNLSFTPFFLEAAVKGLLEYPEINASVEGNKILLKKHINLGCAVAIGNTGLIVPVIKSAEERNLVGLARALNDLALRARSKKLMPDEVQGGTFTVTNPGIFGTMIGYPIINQPQLAILSLGAIKKRAVVIDDAIAIRETCYLTLSYDHRVVDGAIGGQYLKFVREYLENWDTSRSLY